MNMLLGCVLLVAIVAIGIFGAVYGTRLFDSKDKAVKQ